MCFESSAFLNMKKHPFFFKLKVISYLCNLMGSGFSNRRPRIYKVYCLVIIISEGYGYVYSIFGKKRIISYHTMIQLLDNIACFFLLLTCTIFSILNVFVYPQSIIHIIRKIRICDRKLKTDCSKINPYFWSCFFAYHVSVFATTSMDGYVWLSLSSIGSYKFYFLRNIQYYKLSITSFIFCWTSVEIQYRFKVLNNLLKKVYSKQLIFMMHGKTKIVFKNDSLLSASQSIRNISVLHTQLCDIIDAHNNTFGLFTLSSVLFNIAFSVHYGELLIYYGINRKHFHAGDYAPYLVTTCCIWTIVGFVSIFLY